jgi:quercetin dioxygenase-like cupin family protein
MPCHKKTDAIIETVAVGHSRYLAHTDHLMMTVCEFTNGPQTAPDPPHQHPHEQTTYVAKGALLFFMEGRPTRLEEGDLVTIPGNVPHSIQLLTDTVHLVDAFTPLREDLLNK